MTNTIPRLDHANPTRQQQGKERGMTQANNNIPANEGDLLMGAGAIADFLGVSRRQVYRLVQDDIAPSFKLGNTVAARKSSLLKWMQQLEHKQTQQ